MSATIPTNSEDYKMYYSQNRKRILDSMLPVADDILTSVQQARKEKKLYRKLSEEQYELFPEIAEKFDRFVDTLYKITLWGNDYEAVSALLQWKGIKDFIIYMSMDNKASTRFTEIALANIQKTHPDYYDLAKVVTGMMYCKPVKVGGRTISYCIDDIIEHPEKYEKK